MLRAANGRLWDVLELHGLREGGAKVTALDSGAIVASQRDEVPSWLAARVKSRHEKLVSQRLSIENIVSYVPLVKEKHHWARKDAVVEAVLIPGYCFVSVERSQHRVVLTTIGVCGFVTFQKEPAEIPQEEIDVLKNATDPKFMAKEYTGFHPRQAVKIVGTPFDGYIATVDYCTGSHVRVILPMSIGKAVSVVLESENVEPLPVVGRYPATMVEIPGVVQ